MTRNMWLSSSLRLSMGRGSSGPTTTITTFGTLSRAGLGSGVPTRASSISSGDASGHFEVISGYLCVSAAGDTANLNLGPYSLTMNNGDTFTISTVANCWSVTTQAEWDFVIAQATATLSAKVIELRSINTFTTGVDGAAARLRRADFGGLIIRAADMASKPTVDKFFLRGTRNVTFRGLKTTRVAEIKFNLLGETANVMEGIVIDQCEVSGVVADANGNYAISTNYPNLGISLIQTTSSTANGVKSVSVTNCLIEWAGTGIALAATAAAGSITVTGNRIRYFYADGLSVTYGYFDNACTISDNVISEPVGLLSDSGAPHVDAIRLIGKSDATSDWTVTINRNRVFPGNARGAATMHALLASDFMSGATDSGKFFIATVIGNAFVTASALGASISNAKNCVVLNNTVVNAGPGAETIALHIGSTLSGATTFGTHRIERNVVENMTYGGSPTLVANILMGGAGATYSYAATFDGPTFDPDTVDELNTFFSRKTGGPADLAAGPPDAGAVGSTAVTWATTVPGSDGVNLVA